MFVWIVKDKYGEPCPVYRWIVYLDTSSLVKLYHEGIEVHLRNALAECWRIQEKSVPQSRIPIQPDGRANPSLILASKKHIKATLNWYLGRSPWIPYSGGMAVRPSDESLDEDPTSYVAQTKLATVRSQKAARSNERTRKTLGPHFFIVGEPENE